MNGDAVSQLIAGVAVLLLAPAVFAQEPAQQVASTEAASAESGSAKKIAHAEEESERVIVTGKPTRRMVYIFFQELVSNDFCPRAAQTPRGHSCAELTYNIFDDKGKHLGRCTIPIFRLFEFRFQYVVMTFEKIDCTSKTTRRRDLALIDLKEILDPRTADGTVLRKISVVGLDQAKELCAVSSDLCVVDQFDHTKQLSRDALFALWDGHGSRGPR